MGVPSLSNAGGKLQPLPRNVLSSFILLVSFYRYYFCFFSKSLFLTYWKKEIRFPFAAFGQKKERSYIFTSLGRICKHTLRSLAVMIPFFQYDKDRSCFIVADCKSKYSLSVDCKSDRTGTYNLSKYFNYSHSSCPCSSIIESNWFFIYSSLLIISVSACPPLSIIPEAI